MSKYGKRGISLISLIITIIIIVIIATAIILSIAKNNPISQANQAVFKQDVKVMQEILNDEIADISLNEMMPPELYTDDTYATKLKDTTDKKVWINEEAEDVGRIYYMVNGKKGVIIFDTQSSAFVKTIIATEGEPVVENVTTRYTGTKLPTYNYKSIKWYISDGNNMSVTVNNSYTYSHNNSSGEVEVIEEPPIENEEITAENVQYIPNDTSWRVNNVKDALDYLYNN